MVVGGMEARVQGMYACLPACLFSQARRYAIAAALATPAAIRQRSVSINLRRRCAGRMSGSHDASRAALSLLAAVGQGQRIAGSGGELARFSLLAVTGTPHKDHAPLSYRRIALGLER